MRKLTIDTRYILDLRYRVIEYKANLGLDQDNTVTYRKQYLTHWFSVMYEET